MLFPHQDTLGRGDWKEKEPVYHCSAVFCSLRADCRKKPSNKILHTVHLRIVKRRLREKRVDIKIKISLIVGIPHTRHFTSQINYG
jgi:hypothetical protein